MPNARCDDEALLVKRLLPLKSLGDQEAFLQLAFLAGQSFPRIDARAVSAQTAVKARSLKGNIASADRPAAGMENGSQRTAWRYFAIY
jgi:hypothetical protein